MSPQQAATGVHDTDPSSTAPAAGQGSVTPRYRYDIDGLRAIAVLLVVIYHVWLGRVSGGVDAFLIISAFLLTGSLMRRFESTGTVRAFSQWIRNFKRMMPAAALVIIATVGAGLLILPASAQAALWRHASASILYVENWLLASESVDYYADTSLASPLQHFWSLSVQGQVFLLWPLLFLVIAGVSKLITKLSGRERAHAVAFTVFGLVFAASLAYSIVTTQTQQEFAYFDTGARLWEFAAGSLLALVLPWIRLSVIPRAIIGWLGIAALLSCGIVLDVQSGFPGYLALWPVLSVAAVIISGNDEDRRFGPAMLLETRPVQLLGRSSYALYLVHWPMLVFVLFWLQVDQLDFVQGLALIAAAIVLAQLFTLAVDAPLRRNTWIDGARWRGVLVIALCLLIVLAPTMALQQAATRQAAAELAEVEEAPAEVLDLRNPGAVVLASDWAGNITLTAPTRPLATEVPTQWGSLSHNCSDGSLIDLPKSVEICFDNDRPDAEHTIVVMGNSHTQQMLSAIDVIAEDEGWQVISFLYGACAFGLREVDDDRGIFYSQQCRDWNEDVLDLIEEIDPDAVITIGTETIAADIDRRTQAAIDGAGSSDTANVSEPDSVGADEGAEAGEAYDAAVTDDAEATDDAEEMIPEESRNELTGSDATEEHVLEGVEAGIERLEKLNIPLVLIRDNPRFTESAYQCAEQYGDLDGRTGIDRICTVDRDETYAAVNPAAALKSDTTAVIDLSDSFCIDDACPAVIGNTYVYIDDNHLSTVYSATLAPVLGDALVRAFEGFGFLEPQE